MYPQVKMYRFSTRLIKQFQINKSLKLLIRFESSHTNTNNITPLSSTNQFTKDEIKISTKTQTKLPPRKPLSKNFFLGIVDKELLAYPEVISRDDMSKLHNGIANITNYFDRQEATDSTPTVVPKRIKDDIKELGLFGLNVGQHFGGKGFFWSESLIASEFESKLPDLASILISHRIVIDLINSAGTDDQKQKYLSGLASGSIFATEAIFESTIPDNKFFSTIAEYDDSNQQWTLNGEKSFVVSGSDANLFLVLAQTTKLSHSGDNTSGITMFLVDSTLPGVTIVDKSIKTFGCQRSDYCSINFNKVKLSDENIIGNFNDGNTLAQLLLKSQRLRQSLLGFGITKKIISDVVEHSISTNQCGVPLKDMEMTTDRLSKLVCKAYAMESMIYFTSGLMDEFQNQDVDLEAAITKLYCMENLWSVISSSIEFMGPKYLIAGEAGEIDLRNSAHLLIQGESLESLRLFIALTGLQHAGLSVHDTIHKGRNPLFNPGHIFNKFFQLSNIEDPRPKLFLGENLHPSLEPAAQCLELSIVRLQMCTEILLTRYGNEIIEKHVEVKRLTEMITLIYAMFTSLARSSRSYCIGLRLADHELLIATAISLDAKDRIKTIATDISGGPYITNDRNLQRISKQILKSKGYFPEHPLTYNY